MTTELDAHWLFVVDTTRYSGNFEREMTAHVTGRSGECGVGDDVARAALAAAQGALDWTEEAVAHLPDDDNGCRRPALIVPTPGWYNDGHGNHYQVGRRGLPERHYPAYQSVGMAFHRRPTATEVAQLSERAREYAAAHGIPITGFRLLVRRTVEEEFPLP